MISVHEVRRYAEAVTLAAFVVLILMAMALARDDDEPMNLDAGTHVFAAVLCITLACSLAVLVAAAVLEATP